MWLYDLPTHPQTNWAKRRHHHQSHSYHHQLLLLLTKRMFKCSVMALDRSIMTWHTHCPLLPIQTRITYPQHKRTCCKELPQWHLFQNNDTNNWQCNMTLWDQLNMILIVLSVLLEVIPLSPVFPAFVHLAPRPNTDHMSHTWHRRTCEKGMLMQTKKQK